MQGDLMSKKRVIENIWDVFNSYANDSQRFDEYETKAINNAFKVLQKQIENQPTAYDVEKVLEELKQANTCPNCSMYCADANMCGHDEMRKQAIEIVRNGGKE